LRFHASGFAASCTEPRRSVLVFCRSAFAWLQFRHAEFNPCWLNIVFISVPLPAVCHVERCFHLSYFALTTGLRSLTLPALRTHCNMPLPIDRAAPACAFTSSTFAANFFR